MSGRISQPGARPERVPSWYVRPDDSVDWSEELRPALFPTAAEMRAEARRLMTLADVLDPSNAIENDDRPRCSQSIRDDVWLAILFVVVAIVALLIW